MNSLEKCLRGKSVTRKYEKELDREEVSTEDADLGVIDLVDS